MKLTRIALVAAAGIVAATSHAAAPMLYEEHIARVEERQIINAPIAGIENRFWFDYRIDITEAQKELRSDLNRADDVEDLRDAWEEYGRELRQERVHYIDEMAERGYRYGVVTVG